MRGALAATEPVGRCWVGTMRCSVAAGRSWLGLKRCGVLVLAGRAAGWVRRGLLFCIFSSALESEPMIKMRISQTMMATITGTIVVSDWVLANAALTVA